METYVCIVNKDTDNIRIENVFYVSESISENKYKLTLQAVRNQQTPEEQLLYLYNLLPKKLVINTIGIYRTGNYISVSNNDNFTFLDGEPIDNDTTIPLSKEETLIQEFKNIFVNVGNIRIESNIKDYGKFKVFLEFTSASIEEE